MPFPTFSTKPPWRGFTPKSSLESGSLIRAAGSLGNGIAVRMRQQQLRGRTHRTLSRRSRRWSTSI
jgi:hypothetical protein